MISLAERIRAALGTTSQRWYAGLAPSLAACAWADLAAIGLDAENYGVVRVLEANPAASRHSAVLSGLDWGHPVRLELFDENLQRHYQALNLRAPTSSFSAAAFEADLADAMSLLDRVGQVGATVRALVWSITPLDVNGPDFDTGFSDPKVPFSIFIGAHAPEHHISPLRLAEGVLHEALHLQLSLIEAITQLVQGRDYQHQSPWQGRPRPTQGLLHGLYVFRTVQDFFRSLIELGSLRPSDLAHAEERIRQIEFECSELSVMTASVDLTVDGRQLVERLVS